MSESIEQPASDRASGAAHPAAPAVSFVVIGRNEQRHLRRCLESVKAQAGPEADIVYVDSRSIDDSVAIAHGIDGVRVVVLDPDPPPSAARARNRGWRETRGDLVQFVDGDAALIPGWTEAARAALEADASTGAVFGQFRETDPDGSIYNRVLDLDWPREDGPVDTFGGIVMVRRSCLEEAGGFPEDALTGEDPLLALAVRRNGHGVVQLGIPMAEHDLDIHDFGTYWRRCVRTGVSYAEQIAPKRALGVALSETRSWRAAVLTGGSCGLLLAALALGNPRILAVVALLAIVDLVRLTVGHRRQAGSLRVALAYALHLRLSMVAQTVGLLGWLRARRPWRVL